KMGGNENGRGNGERLAVDPNDGKTLYFGSRKAGLWVSHDGAVTWNKVKSSPWAPGNQPAAGSRPGDWYRNQSVRIVYVLFDPKSGKPGNGSNTVYAAVSTTGESNLFESKDKGETWQPIPGETTNLCPTRLALAKDGTLYEAMGASAGPSPMPGGA